MTKKKVTAVTVGTDDIYFIIGSKEVSFLKIMKDLDKKVNRFSLGAWAALGLGILTMIPATIFQLSLVEIKEQSQTIEKQSQTIEKQSQTIQQLSDRLIVVETQIKNK